jgi:gluconolactonase
MRWLPCFFSVAPLAMTAVAFSQRVPSFSKSPPYDDQYVQGPDSQPQPGVPKGKVIEFTIDHSNIYPGTTRTITVYVPAQYRADKPACVYVGLDSIVMVPIVFDNLIAKHEMPVTIAIGLAPGTVKMARIPASTGASNSMR